MVIEARLSIWGWKVEINKEFPKIAKWDGMV